MDIGHITRCPRIVGIRFSTRSSGTVIGLFTPWKGFSSKEYMYRAAGPENTKTPGKGAFAQDERSSSGAMGSGLSCHHRFPRYASSCRTYSVTRTRVGPSFRHTNARADLEIRME